MAEVIRGRVIARRSGTILVRTADGDREVEPAGEAEPGDLIEHDGEGEPRVVRAYLRGEYPTPETETARLGGGRMANLQARARIMAALREFFAGREFVEVETPLLVHSPGLELHIEAVPAGYDRYLITSPEYQMKRLLAGGMERIFTTCKCFRAEESGALHNVEFTMLEWYRSWAELDEIRDDTEHLVAHCATAINGRPKVRVRDREIDVSPPWTRVTVAEAMDEHAGVRVRGDESAEELAESMRVAGVELNGATAWDDIFYTAFINHVEPALAAMDAPVILHDWPVRLAALARRKPGAAHVVERFEAYIGGVELANAFGELTDPVEQRSRFVEEQLERRDRNLPAYPIDEKLIAALEEGLPPCAGIALGIDRLVMLVLGVAEIRHILTFATAEL